MESEFYGFYPKNTTVLFCWPTACFICQECIVLPFLDFLLCGKEKVCGVVLNLKGHGVQDVRGGHQLAAGQGSPEIVCLMA